MKITVEQIMEKSPCQSDWPEERVRKVIGSGKTLKQILKLKTIPKLEDRIWCAVKFSDDKTNRAFAIWCARQCKTDVKEITEYINVIERYYGGKATEEELRAACWAACSAAYSVANSAANSAADWAAYSVANSAANSAADWAADSEARKKQIKKFLELID